MSKRIRCGSMTRILVAVICTACTFSSVQSAELTNGKNGQQPNSLDSENPTGSAGVAPSRGILKQGDTQTPDALQSGEKMPTTEKPKQQN